MPKRKRKSKKLKQSENNDEYKSYKKDSVGLFVNFKSQVFESKKDKLKEDIHKKKYSNPKDFE